MLIQFKTFLMTSVLHMMSYILGKMEILINFHFIDLSNVNAFFLKEGFVIAFLLH